MLNYIMKLNHIKRIFIDKRNKNEINDIYAFFTTKFKLF